MLAVHLTCPRCARHLRSNRLIALGEPLRCPRCGAQFRAGFDDAPESARVLSPPRSQGGGLFLGWLLFVAVLLLAGVGLALAVLISNRSESGARAERVRPDSQSESATLASEPLVLNRQSPRIERADVRAPDPPPPPDAAPARKPTARPDPLRNPPPVRHTPPPLPEPPRPDPPKEAPPKAEKRRVAPAPGPEEAPQVRWLPARVQRQVDRAIDSGVEFLRRQQRANGSWGHQTGNVGKRFTPGITALSALTLLECGVPAKDPQVQQAARYLRQRMPDLTVTYSISLAILFFDRLGAESDAARIRTLALRLIAGQKTSGGWDYYCPKLSEDEELGLLALLYKDRPATPRDLFLAEPIKLPMPDLEQARETPKLEGDLYRPQPSKVPPLDLFIAQDPAVKGKSTAEQAPKPPAGGKAVEKKAEAPAPPDRSEPAPRRAGAADPALPRDNRRLSKRALEAADRLPEALRQTPALRSAELMESPPDLHEPRTDNSNTQFAILGLLAAENHDVPMERATALLDWRFRNSLTMQFGWNYRPSWPTTPAMTAAGLMGLALKHGLLLPNPRDRGRNVTVRDPLIQHGFFALDGQLEQYLAGFHFNQTMLEKLDLYCLWTVERVAVLYNLRKLGTLDWYPVGVELLLPLQRDNGSWSPAGTKSLEEPAVSTSFALLFLKRSDLARDLTRRLNIPREE